MITVVQSEYRVQDSLGETVQDSYPKGIAQKVICPVCGDFHVHARTPGSQSIGSDYAFSVACYCEQGHSWDIRLHFHEGETVIYLLVDEKPASFMEFLQQNATLFGAEDRRQDEENDR